MIGYRALVAVALSVAGIVVSGGVGASPGGGRAIGISGLVTSVPIAADAETAVKGNTVNSATVRVALSVALAPAQSFARAAQSPLIRAASPPKIGCLSGFVFRDARDGDGVCVTPQERDAAKRQNIDARQHTRPSGDCHNGFVWRDAWNGDAVCVTPEQRATAKAQNAMDARRSRYQGVAVPVTPAPPPAPAAPSRQASLCQSGFVWRDARDGDAVCVTPQQRAEAKRQNADAGSKTLPSGQCISGFVWRNAWDGDAVCVTPQERAAAKRQNAKSAELGGANVPPPAATQPAPEPAQNAGDQPDADRGSDVQGSRKSACKGSFVWRDPDNDDFVCVTRTERALARQQDLEAASHTTESGRCHPGFVWREAFDGDVVCVTKAERAMAKAQNALNALRSKGDADGGDAAQGTSHCKNGFVARKAGKNDFVCVTREERKIAAQQNENGPNNAKPSGECRSGYVWRDAWDGDAVCVTPAERSEAKAENARGPQNSAN